MSGRRGLAYREHRPSQRLQRFVECYWTLRGEPSPGAGPSRVIPDGCSDLLFDLGRTARVEGQARPTSYVVGAMTRALRVSHTGSVDLLAVRFRPGGAPPFLGSPLGELTDGWADARLLWGGSADELEERLAGASSVTARVAHLERALLRRAGAAPERFDPVVLRAVSLLGGADALHRSPTAVGRTGGRSGTPTVAGVADDLGVSRRHLERRFRAHVGLSPGQLRMVLRLRRAAELITASDFTLGRIAARAGFHDHAHMVRDFGALVGLTPGDYRREERRVPRDGGGAEPGPRVPRGPVASVQDGPDPER